MGLSSPRQRLQALRSLSDSAMYSDDKRGEVNLRRAWSEKVEWRGRRQSQPTWFCFPLCCVIYLLRLLSENGEQYELSNHALSINIKSPLCYTRNIVINLRSITSLVLVEADPVTGQQKCLGMRLCKSETFLRIHTECGTFAALRLKRNTAEETLSMILDRVRSARAIASAVEVAGNRLRARRYAGRRRRMESAGGEVLADGRGERGCLRIFREAFRNRRSTAFWVR